MRIHGIEVDFVNLRAQEIYEDDSRIPTTQFGTPLEDALRRDFTVNSLFYNIRTNQIEDWTNRGIHDLLHHRILVTPVHPLTTFHDDPLRVLRAIRFSVRFDLLLHQDIRDAAMDSKVHDSLHVKVSRERVGKELEGMLSGKSTKPDKALDLITQLNLAGCIFSFPPENQGHATGTLIGAQYGDISCHEKRAHAREQAWLQSTELVQWLPETLLCFKNELQSGNPSSKSTPVDNRLLYLTVFLLPFRHLSYLDKKQKTETVVTYMIRESIKFKNKDISSIHTIMLHFDEMKRILEKFKQTKHMENDSNPPFCRLETGLLLRNLKDLWVTCLMAVTVQELSSLPTSMHSDSKAEKIKAIFQTFCDFYQSVHNQNLNECWKQRPLLDGRALIPLLEIPKGPSIGKYIQKQIEWMLLNPDGIKEDCGKHLQTLRKRELEGQSDEQNKRQCSGSI
eukprot:CAMPEP_0197827676 /NCGR_PEP_ID=MMETSP1437-20131217/4409_1 /TAXON_ID=49252 ORGANISM="Eucampia antarctica, Strain CCMP1452" /NCGR_SAMPLE_ID=MMETSP1437 /ASSEMBLY_ACC=CAM_ASM_001096 /LENGTH=450 /DNA_ID=CAMNT_0043428625 /DNA_START=264 /DNA_END=1616 /DNA_ORIENTATION=-